MLWNALCLLWLAWVLQAVLSLSAVARFARLLRKTPRHSYDTFQPPVTLIVPFKGLEPGLEDAVRSLCTQDYPQYELYAVVESADDPACDVLRRVLGEHPQQPSQLVVAGVAPPTVGQKVHNQLAVLQRVEPDASDQDVWVFADSDAVPDRQWLNRLVGPLVSKSRNAVTTGYRWLVPTDAAADSLPTQLASVINSSVACLLGKPKRNFAWGGSMAMRVAVARYGDLIGRLRGAVTDDYPVSRMARDLNMRIVFVPGCLVATPVSFTWASLINFGHRQYLITRVYAPLLFLLGLGITSLYVAGVWSAVLATAATVGAARVWFPLSALMLVMGLGFVRGSVRADIVRRSFGEDSAGRLRRALRWDRFGAPLWMTLHWLLMLRACIGRRMTWRGVRYELRGPNDIRRLN